MIDSTKLNDAFVIQVKRKLWTVPVGDQWGLRMEQGHNLPLAFITQTEHRGLFPDPITAIIEADKWLTAVEKEASP